MKKIIAIALCVVMLFSLAACGEKEAPKAESAPSNAPENVSIILSGITVGNKYTSTTNGLTFIAPEGWTFYSKDQIASLMGASADLLLDGKEYSEEILEKQAIYDAMAVDSATGASVSISYENLKLSNNSGMDENAYFDLTEQLLKQQTTMEVKIDGRSNASLGTKDYVCSKSTVTLNGTTMTQLYYARSLGDYMSLVVVTLPENATYTQADIENMFA